MKRIIILLQAVLLIATNSCYSQKLVQTQQEASKLVENQDKFVGKPLKVLLEEIKPQIKSYYASKNSAPGGAIVFLFVPYERIYKNDSKGSNPLRIRVVVKEPFDWDFKTRPKGSETIWTKEDAKKYENLTVAAIYVTGEVQQ